MSPSKPSSALEMSLLYLRPVPTRVTPARDPAVIGDACSSVAGFYRYW
jgi:hypothetical protein